MEHPYPYAPVRTEQEPNQRHGPSQAALVLGIVAMSCNVLLIFAVFGVILGLIAVILGAVHYRRHRYAKAGLILGLLSFLPLVVYLFSMLVMWKADPLLF